MTSKEYLRRYKELTEKEEITEMEIETLERRLLTATAAWKDSLLKEKEEAEAKLKEIRTALKEIIKTTKKISPVETTTLSGGYIVLYEDNSQFAIQWNTAFSSLLVNIRFTSYFWCSY